MVDAIADDFKQLVEDLEAAAKLPKRGKAYKTICQISNCEKKVSSWKFNEWDYGKNNIRLPVNARGLFILEHSQKPRIVVRGYDKFFNIDEVASTSWSWLTSNTVGPYEVTVKENGCIIFISSLEDGTLVVCSKHSTGSRDDTDRNHSVAGEKFLMKQLQASGIDPKTLGLELYHMNATAVAEYCDDSFEEHILEYTKDAAGLYIHGINQNERIFKTMPMHEVNNFAERYGFKKIEHFTHSDITSLRKFLEECANVGTFRDKEIEGFVIRCKKVDGKTFFFKFKFEEPYLMYRQWREATKKYIATKSRVFSFRKHRFITNKYLDFVIPLLDADPKLCDDYMKDFGIIKLRKMFLLDFGLTGVEILNSEKIKNLEAQNAIDYQVVDENTKFLFIPIATIGCGKTTTALTLTYLYPESWGHVQNDDITGRDKSLLMKKSLELLGQEHVKAVIVDRNNHQFRERKQLFEWFADLKEKYMPYDCNVKIIALSFLPYEDIEETSKLTIRRVLARGDRHQSIKVKTDGEKKVLGIMKGFLNRYQPVIVDQEPDSMFDRVITLNVREKNSSLANVQEILRVLHDHYPILVPEIPLVEKIRSAFEKSLLYEPKITKVVGGGKKHNKESLKLKPVYFSAEIPDSKVFLKYIRGLCLEQKGSLDISAVLEGLQDNTALRKMHITLSHVGSGKKGSKKQRDMWCEFNKRYSDTLIKLGASTAQQTARIQTNDKVLFRIIKLLWDENIITALAEVADECITDGESGEIVRHLGCANDYAHITLALLQPGVKPFYSNVLCQAMSENHGFQEGHFADGTNCLELGNTASMDAHLCINL
ncbi:LAME_0H03532g1_1 [Lachancea meyersii CBS 8951]|uniref:tRNA ligase n=1 Tax=Lachancea meyersii CBS 8951 TaxID=1266667 RepID=A0A1G4KDR9_9SACH|nr:LAME_0H03532g1_1 [Lachancea meyersii CBS 8951]